MGLLEFFRGKPSPDGFARMVMAGMHKAGITANLNYDVAAFRISVGDNPMENSLFLANAYQEYCTVPRSQRQALLQKYVDFMAKPRPEPPARFEDAKPNLLPRVRDRYFYEALRLQMQIDYGHAHDVPTQPLSDHLAVELAYDFPDTVATVNRCQLDSWRVSLEEALKVARDNLWKISNESFRQEMPGFFVSPWTDHHAASRLFLHDLIWQLTVKGDHIAMAPHRDLLIVTGSDDPEGLNAMCSLAETTLGEPRALTARPVRLQGKQWYSFEPGSDHLAFSSLRNLRARVEADEYARQKELLEAEFNKAKDDIFVATTMLFQDQKSGLLSTFATWSQGVRTLIPKADRIGFVRFDSKGKPGEARLADWHRVLEVASDLMKSEGTYPERYRVMDFPSEEQLASMGATAPDAAT